MRKQLTIGAVLPKMEGNFSKRKEFEMMKKVFDGKVAVCDENQKGCLNRNLSYDP